MTKCYMITIKVSVYDFGGVLVCERDVFLYINATVCLCSCICGSRLSLVWCHLVDCCTCR